jgi:hypothetical protein
VEKDGELAEKEVILRRPRGNNMGSRKAVWK